MNISQINTLARRLSESDTASYSDANLLVDVNNAYEEIVGELIIESAGGNWHFGDSNFTSLPTGLFTLVNSQAEYQLTGNGTTGINTTTPLLNFLGASVKDEDGNWNVLKPITLWELLENGIDPVEYFKTDGRPQYYEKREDFLVLYPAPDNGVSVTLVSGLKVFFQRTASVFTSAEVTTGTKIPGFASPYHPLLAYKAALVQCSMYKSERVPILMSEINRMKNDLLLFYAYKEQDMRKVMTMRRIQYL